MEWFTGTCVLLALPMAAEVSTILNPFVEIKTERMGQKTNKSEYGDPSQPCSYI